MVSGIGFNFYIIVFHFHFPLSYQFGSFDLGISIRLFHQK